ncbi:MAG: carboxypeptidase M32 [Halobacteriaceae archaeon]
MTEDAYDAFTAYTEQILNLSHASRILDWDQQVMMPPGGTTARASQLAALSRAEHDRLRDDELANLLDAVADQELTPVQAANVREMRRRHERAVRVPSALVERTRAARSDAYDRWRAAKEADEFDRFAPVLEELVALRREYADHIDPDRDPYQLLYEEFEPYIPYETAVEILSTLREELPPLIEAIRASDTAPSGDAFSGSVPVADQEAFVRAALTELGFDWDRGRLDTSDHPFQRGSPFDARLTTRFDEDDLLDGLTSAIHEFGHALYVQQLPEDQYGMPVGEARDMVIHESQSRFWENHVARSRAFWETILPLAREHVPALEGVSAAEAYRSANVVAPDTPIRTAADEVSYHLHIVVRFEIERALIRGDLEVEDVPDVWDAKMDEYLGVTADNHGEGVLQDVHWSNATFGYFPTYSLGSVAAAQFRTAFEEAVAPMEVVIREDGFTPIADWLEAHVHRYGKQLRTDDLVEEVTGRPLSAAPMLDCFHRKYGGLYDLEE